MTAYKYCPKLPLDLTKENTFFYIEDLLENVKQKLKMIILTFQGEKIMDPLFGLGIKKYLFEQTSGYLEAYATGDSETRQIVLKDLKQDILEKLTVQVEMYSPDIKITNLDLKIDENVMLLSIFYIYQNFVSDNLEMSIIL